MVVFHGGQVSVFESGMVDRADDCDSAAQQAIGQVRERGHVDEYRDRRMILTEQDAIALTKMDALQGDLSGRPPGSSASAP